jgi:antimicrobial peptide system SdpB family protein
VLAAIGSRLSVWVTAPWPWSSRVGLARCLLARSTASTLIFNRGDTLFVGLSGEAVEPICQGVGRVGLFCIVDSGAVAMLVGLGVLGLVVLGFAPRITCVPHWWVSSSTFLSVSVADGGEQVAAVLSALLIPVCITDGRLWHWSRSPTESAPLRALIARVGLLAVHLQIAFLYFHACVGKLAVEEWANGTAVYYWLVDPLVDAPAWIANLSKSTIGVVLLTWGTLFVEGALAFALLMPGRIRGGIIACGFVLHLGIWAVMGLASFSIAMIAALVLLSHSGDQGGRPSVPPSVPLGIARRHALASNLTLERSGAP